MVGTKPPVPSPSKAEWRFLHHVLVGDDVVAAECLAWTGWLYFALCRAFLREASSALICWLACCVSCISDSYSDWLSIVVLGEVSDFRLDERVESVVCSGSGSVFGILFTDLAQQFSGGCQSRKAWPACQRGWAP